MAILIEILELIGVIIEILELITILIEIIELIEIIISILELTAILIENFNFNIETTIHYILPPITAFGFLPFPAWSNTANK